MFVCKLIKKNCTKMNKKKSWSRLSNSLILPTIQLQQCHWLHSSADSTSSLAVVTGLTNLPPPERALNDPIRATGHHDVHAPLGSSDSAHWSSPPAGLPSPPGSFPGPATSSEPTSATIPSFRCCSSITSTTSAAALSAIVAITGCCEAEIFE